MGDWLHNLAVPWMAVVVFLGTYAMAGAIYSAVTCLAVGERARAFKGVSPGLLPPLGILFGLLVGFLAAQVWSDAERAHTAVNREASALRDVVLLAAGLPGEPEARLRALVRRHIDDAVTREWPAMAQGRATLLPTPVALAEALRVTFALTPGSNSEMAAQREMVAALERALDARRQRIIASRSSVNWVKWTGLILEAGLALLAIAFVHSDNRITAALAVTIFASAVAVAIVMILAHDRPFTGRIAVTPDVLLQALPD